MNGKKTPINWWRVTALAAVPLFLHSTWQYAESAARLIHHLEHCASARPAAPHDHPAPVVPSPNRPMPRQ